MHLFALFVSQLYFVSYVLCNTEIINFSVEDTIVSPELPFTQTWPILHSGLSVLDWNASLADSSVSSDVCLSMSHWSPDDRSPCPNEYWVVLDLDAVEWQKFSKFTARISWPAYYPTTISITVFNPDSLAASIGHAQSGQTRRTRRRYARIQTVFTGVRTPGGSGDFDPIWYHQVPMTLKLEPLYFGALPQSVIPIVCAIAAAIVLGYPVANRISEILRGLAEDIRQNESKPTKID